MDMSLFFAKFIGLYLIIVAGALFLRPQFFRDVYRDFYRNAAVTALGAIMSLFFGLFIVINHNIWELSWKLVITLIGYLSLLKGILNLYTPDVGKKMTETFLEKNYMTYSGIISIALGFYLIYQGYF